METARANKPPVAALSQDAESIAACMEALGNPARVNALRLLVSAGSTGMTFGQIQSRLDIPASTLSHHMAALARVELVRQERFGRQVRSYANIDVMRSMIEFLMAQCCTLEDELACDDGVVADRRKRVQ